MRLFFLAFCFAIIVLSACAQETKENEIVRAERKTTIRIFDHRSWLETPLETQPLSADMTDYALEFGRAVLNPGREDSWHLGTAGGVCFEGDVQDGKVSSLLCFASPWSIPGAKLILEKPLPAHEPLKVTDFSEPWALVLADGTTCFMTGGATFVYQGKRANYSCDDENWVVGFPTQDDVWQVERVTVEDDPLNPIPLGSINVLVAWY